MAKLTAGCAIYSSFAAAVRTSGIANSYKYLDMSQRHIVLPNRYSSAFGQTATNYAQKRQKLRFAPPDSGFSQNQRKHLAECIMSERFFPIL